MWVVCSSVNKQNLYEFCFTIIADMWNNTTNDKTNSLTTHFFVSAADVRY